MLVRVAFFKASRPAGEWRYLDVELNRSPVVVMKKSRKYEVT